MANTTAATGPDVAKRNAGITFILATIVALIAVIGAVLALAISPSWWVLSGICAIIAIVLFGLRLHSSILLQVGSIESELRTASATADTLASSLQQFVSELQPADLREQAIVQSEAEAVTEKSLADDTSGATLSASKTDLAVAAYTVRIGERLGFPQERLEQMRVAALVRDLGMAVVPTHANERRGPLTDAEWELLKTHPHVSARICRAYGLNEISDWVAAHHERPDGEGYPAGLSGNQIPVEAAIIAVADAFVAMTSERPYRHVIPAATALTEMHKHSGTQFLAGAVEALIDCTDETITPEHHVGVS